MTTDTKVADLPAKWRAKAKRIRGATDGSDLAADIMEGSAEDLEAALARQEAAPISVDRLAQIIRRLDGRHTLGAYEMAEAILAEVSIPAPPAAQAVGLDAVRECLGEIADLSTALRHGGPAPEDLHGLSDALEDATSIAYDMCKIIDQQAGKGVA